MRVAVTGAAGKIGSEVCRQLRERGHDVLAMDLRLPADPAHPFRVIDLRAASAVRHAFDGMEAVCHLGEIPSAHGQQPAALVAHNVEIGASVMQIAAELQIPRVIYTSTCQIYGCWGADVGPLVAPPAFPMDETAPRRPQNAYAISKVCNELFAEMLARKWNTAIAAFRFPWIVNAREIDIDRIIKRHWGPGYPMLADGFSTYLALEDAAGAYICALERGWTGFEAFHFVADDVLTDEPVPQALARIFPDMALPADLPDHAAPVSTEKARRMLGWTPAVRLSDQIRQRLAGG